MVWCSFHEMLCLFFNQTSPLTTITCFMQIGQREETPEFCSIHIRRSTDIFLWYDLSYLLKPTWKLNENTIFVFVTNSCFMKSFILHYNETRLNITQKLSWLVFNNVNNLQDRLKFVFWGVFYIYFNYPVLRHSHIMSLSQITDSDSFWREERSGTISGFYL